MVLGLRTSNILNWLIEPIVNDLVDETESDSTEDMLRGVYDTNEVINELNYEEKKRVMIFSMYAEALYPNIRKKDILKELWYVIQKTNLEYNVDVKELGKYIAIVYVKDEIEKLNIKSCIPSRRVYLDGKTRKKPGIAYLDTDTYMKTEKDIKTKTDKWSWKGKQIPSEMQKKKMIGLAMMAAT